MATGDGNQVMNYFRLCQGTFKKWYSNHLCSFRHERYRSSTELSKHVWKLKEKGTDFTISWSVYQKAIPYSSGSKRCQLCLAEKLYIISAEPKSLLKKKKLCRHAGTEGSFCCQPTPALPRREDNLLAPTHGQHFHTQQPTHSQSFSTHSNNYRLISTPW